MTRACIRIPKNPFARIIQDHQVESISLPSVQFASISSVVTFGSIHTGKSRRSAAKNFHSAYQPGAEQQFEQKSATVVHASSIATLSETLATFLLLCRLTLPPAPSPRTLPTSSLPTAGDFHSCDSSKLDEYIETHRVVDVFGPEWDPLLRRLFLHALLEDLDYFVALRNSWDSGHNLTLVYLKHNEHPFCANVFTCRDDMPADHQGLAVVVREASLIFVLLRATAVARDIS